MFMTMQRALKVSTSTIDNEKNDMFIYFLECSSDKNSFDDDFILDMI